MPTAERLRTSGWQVAPLVLAVGAALVAAVAFITLFLANKILAVLLIGGALFFALLTVTRNQRLFCLWGAILSAPMAVSKSFVIIAHMGGAGAYTIEPLDVFLVLLLAFMLRDLSRGARPPFRLSPVAFWWGGMIALGVMSTILGPLRQVSAQEVLRMLKCFALFFVIINEVLRRRQIMHVVAALAVCVAIQSGAALVQGIFHANLHLQVLGEASPESITYASEATYAGGGEEGFRVNGLMGHPNLLAAFLSMLLPMCLALLFARIPLIAKAVLGLISLMGGVALVLTLSRTGWLTFGIALAILYLVSFVHPRLRSRFIFARVAMLGLVAASVLAFMGKISKRLFESDPGALNFRYEWNKVAWDMGKDHLLTGVGLNTFVFNLPGHTKYGGVAGLNEHFGDAWPAAHNIYLLTWAEQGAPGLLMFIGLNLYLVYVGLRNSARYVDDAVFAVNVGCLAGMVSLLVDGLASFFIRNPAPARIFWIFAGLIVAIDYWNRANARVASPTHGPRRRKASAAPAPATAPEPS
jgi:hypothetical protein